MTSITSTLDSEGYSEGQRDRALVLDWICSEHLQGDAFGRKDHPAWVLTNREFQDASDALEIEGKIFWCEREGGLFSVPTPAGLAAHAAAQRALSNLDAAIGA